MKMRFLIPAVFAVATLSAAKVEAQVACSTDDVLFAGVTAATACYGSFIGNDVPNNFDMIKTMFFEVEAGGEWGVLGKSDNVGDMIFGSVDDGSSGTIMLADPISGTFGLSIKEGRFYSAYLWEGVGSSNFFTYETPNGQGLSHATLWDNEGDFVIVPEPSSFAMMFLGLAGLGVAARRRRNV